MEVHSPLSDGATEGLRLCQWRSCLPAMNEAPLPSCPGWPNKKLFVTIRPVRCQMGSGSKKKKVYANRALEVIVPPTNGSGVVAYSHIGYNDTLVNVTRTAVTSRRVVPLLYYARFSRRLRKFPRYMCVISLEATPRKKLYLERQRVGSASHPTDFNHLRSVASSACF